MMINNRQLEFIIVFQFYEIVVQRVDFNDLFFTRYIFLQ